jgi:heme-degrading monooxygenase HmoA
MTMLCRVATHERTPDITSEDARRFRSWLKEQPGMVRGYHVQDSKTGRTVSITIWESEEDMMALKNVVPPGGSIGLKPTVEIFDVVEEF